MSRTTTSSPAEAGPHVADLYPTPAWVLDVTHPRHPLRYAIGSVAHSTTGPGSILVYDVGCGDGRIAAAARRASHSAASPYTPTLTIAGDVRPSDDVGAYLGAGVSDADRVIVHVGDHTKPEGWYGYGDGQPIDDRIRGIVVVSNPPYGRREDYPRQIMTAARAWREHVWTWARRGVLSPPPMAVCMLLRMGWLADGRREVDGRPSRHEWLLSTYGMPDVHLLDRRPEFARELDPDSRGTDSAAYAWMVWTPIVRSAGEVRLWRAEVR